MAYSTAPYFDYAKRSTNNLAKANSSVLSLIPAVGNITTPAHYIANGRPVQAAASVIAGSAGGIGADIVHQGVKTSQRVARQGGGLKKRAFAFTRGLTTGTKNNRRNMVNLATGGGATIAENINNAVVKSPIGKTKVGQMLTKDISTPLMTKLKPRRFLRKISGGLFSEHQLFLCDF